MEYRKKFKIDFHFILLQNARKIMSIVAYAHSTLLAHFLSYKLLKSEFNIYRKDVIDIHFLFIFAFIFT